MIVTIDAFPAAKISQKGSDMYLIYGPKSILVNLYVL